MRIPRKYRRRNFFVRYKDDQVGPFFAFADAAAMHEALRQGHPEAEVVLDDAGN